MGRCLQYSFKMNVGMGAKIHLFARLLVGSEISPENVKTLGSQTKPRHDRQPSGLV